MPSASQLAALYFLVTLGAYSTAMVETSAPSARISVGHLAGGVAQIVVADGQGGNAAALADAFLTGDHRHHLRACTTLAMASVLEAAVLSVGM